jgi:hypothetical protein
MSGDIPLLSLYAFMAWTGETLFLLVPPNNFNRPDMFMLK